MSRIQVHAALCKSLRSAAPATGVRLDVVALVVLVLGALGAALCW